MTAMAMAFFFRCREEPLSDTEVLLYYYIVKQSKTKHFYELILNLPNNFFCIYCDDLFFLIIQ